MISHHERTQQLYPDQAEAARVDSSLPDLSERSKSLPPDLLSLTIEDLQDDYGTLWDYFENSEEKGEEVDSKLDDLDKIGHIGLTLRRIVSDNISGKTLRKDEKDLLEEVIRIDPDLEKDILVGSHTNPVDVSRILNIISQYYKGSSVEHGAEVCDEAKNHLVSFLQGDSSALLIPDPKVRSRMVETILATPLVVTDPLSTATAMGTNEFEYGGFFTSSKDRIAFVTFSPHSDLRDPIVRAKKTSTTYHELLHACFARNYLSVDHEEDEYGEAYTEIKQKILFPWFVEEAVVEKIAFHLTTEDLAAAGLLDGIVESYPGEFDTRREMRSRVGKYASYTLDSIGQEKLPSVFIDAAEEPRQEKARRLVYNSYPQFRVVLDYIFASVGWEAIGMNRTEAEGMLANAVFEVPQDTSDKTNKWPHRKLFFSKLREAKAAGVFNRFNSAIRNFGVEDVTKWFDERPRQYLPGTTHNVDVTDPNILPDSTHYGRHKVLERRLANEKERLERLISLGAPSLIVKPQRERVSNIRKELQEQEKKALPAIGFKAHIDTDKQNYFKRRDRKSLNALERRGLAEYKKRRESARDAGYRKI